MVIDNGQSTIGNHQDVKKYMKPETTVHPTALTAMLCSSETLAVDRDTTTTTVLSDESGSLWEDDEENMY